MSGYKHLVVENEKLIKRLVEYSGLDAALIQNFIHFSGCMVKPESGLIDQQIFLAVFAKFFNLYDRHLNTKFFYRLAKSFYQGEKGMMVEDFCHALCTFYTEDLDKRINCVFWAYDVNDDGTLDYNELQFFMKSCRCVDDTDEADKEETFNDLSNFTSDILSLGPNEEMDLEHFRKKVKGNSLVLYILGQIIPQSDISKRFKELIQGKTYREMKDMFGNIRYKLLHEIPSIDPYKYYPILLDYP